MRCEDVGIGFLILDLKIAAGGVGTETAWIDAQHVDRRFALDDPFGELPAGAAGRGHAKGMALVQPEIPEVPGRTHDGRAVRRIGDGAVIYLLDADLAECRHAN